MFTEQGAFSAGWRVRQGVVRLGRRGGDSTITLGLSAFPLPQTQTPLRREYDTLLGQIIINGAIHHEGRESRRQTSPEYIFLPLQFLFSIIIMYSGCIVH
jgi:hypothetical protein